LGYPNNDGSHDAESLALSMLQKLSRANLDEHVADLNLREKLRPHYRAGCKRPIISPNLYDAIQQLPDPLVAPGIRHPGRPVDLLCTPTSYDCSIAVESDSGEVITISQNRANFSHSRAWNLLQERGSGEGGQRRSPLTC
jgi:hypothetical protein